MSWFVTYTQFLNTTLCAIEKVFVQSKTPLYCFCFCFKEQNKMNRQATLNNSYHFPCFFEIIGHIHKLIDMCDPILHFNQNTQVLRMRIFFLVFEFTIRHMITYFINQFHKSMEKLSHIIIIQTYFIFMVLSPRTQLNKERKY